MKEERKTNNHWIAQHEQFERLQQVLNCFLPRGLATCEQVEIMTGLGQHPVRDALKILSQPPGGLAVLLTAVNVTLPGQRGRPFSAYVLTKEGTTALGEVSRKAPMLNEPVEAAHALMEMQIFIAAFRAGKKTEVEKVINYEGLHNIRADILFEDQILFEVEQQARLNDVPRISDKLDRLVRFFNSPASKRINSKVRILFGLATNDGQTIRIWQQVLGAIQKKTGLMPFELYWQNIEEFLENPIWDDLSEFALLEPNAPAQAAASSIQQNIPVAKAFQLPAFVQRNQVDMEELHIVMNVMESGMGLFDDHWTGGRHLFFEMMEVIYDGSHYSGGPVEREAAFPVTSLMLLYRFLHLHQNKPLLEQIQTGYKKVLLSQRQGITFFRDILTRFYWDVFLRYFNFGRNGPLKVCVEVPSFSDDRSEIYSRVSITELGLLADERGVITYGDRNHAEKALIWVLESLYLHAFDLGLAVEKGVRER